MRGSATTRAVADYQQELRLAEDATADGLGNARDEYLEYNQ
jgi:hypothetical protein